MKIGITSQNTPRDAYLRNLTSLKVHENKLAQRRHELMKAGNSKALAVAASIDGWDRAETSLERDNRVMNLNRSVDLGGPGGEILRQTKNVIYDPTKKKDNRFMNVNTTSPEHSLEKMAHFDYNQDFSSARAKYAAANQSVVNKPKRSIKVDFGYDGSGLSNLLTPSESKMNERFMTHKRNKNYAFSNVLTPKGVRFLRKDMPTTGVEAALSSRQLTLNNKGLNSYQSMNLVEGLQMHPIHQGRLEIAISPQNQEILSRQGSNIHIPSPDELVRANKYFES